MHMSVCVAEISIHLSISLYFSIVLSLSLSLSLSIYIYIYIYIYYRNESMWINKLGEIILINVLFINKLGEIFFYKPFLPRELTLNHILLTFLRLKHLGLILNLIIFLPSP